MKAIKTGLVIVLAGLLFYGCKEKNSGIEVVPNLDTEYLSIKQVDSIPENKDFYKKEAIDFERAVKSLPVENANKWTLFEIDLRAYCNKDGKVEKIKDLFSNDNSFQLPDSVQLYKDRDKMNKELALQMGYWKFGPAIKDGKRVKFWVDLKYSITHKPNGKYFIGIPEFLLIYPPPDSYIPVDSMPQITYRVIPHYPELAKRAGIEGVVYIKALIDKEGNPVKVFVMKSDHDIFNQTSIDAAMKFKFTPAMKDNKHVAVWVVIPFKYKLDGSKGELMKYKDLKKMPARK